MWRHGAWVEWPGAKLALLPRNAVVVLEAMNIAARLIQLAIEPIPLSRRDATIGLGTMLVSCNASSLAPEVAVA